MCRRAEDGKREMICSRELIEGLVDEELDPATKAEVEEHLGGCPNCSATYSQIREQQAAIRSYSPYYNAPAHLEQSVRDALRRTSSEKTRVEGRNASWRLLAIAASVLLVCSLGWNISQLHTRAPEQEIMAQNILSSHVRSLIGTHLLDVVSTDQHTVKPWFNGKIDFSPVVRDFSLQGFPLIGGRIEYLSGRTIAALVYQRRKHIINLFTWPSSASAGNIKESRFARNGYNELQWVDASMTYWAVSDLGLAELQQFKDLCTK
jgi:anti-sigma factor RsiW